LKAGNLARLGEDYLAFLNSKERAMGILAWIVLGLIAGLLARFFMPGAAPGGIIVTIVLGIVGGLLGGWLGTQFNLGTVDAINLHSILLSVAGAVIVLAILRLVQRR
jgi:uncharacterized membrane protein YeaQ/YmgE (transglycosylase-associated protein family)